MKLTYKNIFEMSLWRENRLCFANEGADWSKVTSKSQEIGKLEAKLKKEAPAEKMGEIQISKMVNDQLTKSKTEIDKAQIDPSFKTTARVSILNDMGDFFKSLVDKSSGEGSNVNIESLKTEAFQIWEKGRNNLLQDIRQIESETKSVEGRSRLKAKGESPEKNEANTERARKQNWNTIDIDSYKEKQNLENLHLKPAEAAQRNLQLKASGFVESLPRGIGGANYICTKDVITSAENARRWFEAGASGDFTKTKTSEGRNFYMYTIQRHDEEKALNAYPLIAQYASIGKSLEAIGKKRNGYDKTKKPDSEFLAQLDQQEKALQAQQNILSEQIKSALASADWKSPAEVEREQKYHENKIKGYNTELTNQSISELGARLKSLPEKEEERTPSQKKEAFYLEVQITVLKIQTGASAVDGLDKKINEAKKMDPAFQEKLPVLGTELTPAQNQELRTQALLEFAKREYQKLATPKEDQDKLTAMNAALDTCLTFGAYGDITFQSPDTSFIKEPSNISQLNLNFSLLQGIQEKIGGARKQISFLISNVSTEVEAAKKSLETTGTGEQFVAWLESWNPFGNADSGLTQKQKDIKVKVESLKLKLRGIAGSAAKLQEASQHILEKGTTLKGQRETLSERKKNDAKRIDLTRVGAKENYLNNKENLEQKEKEIRDQFNKKELEISEARKIAQDQRTAEQNEAIRKQDELKRQLAKSSSLQDNAETAVMKGVKGKIEGEIKKKNPNISAEDLKRDTDKQLADAKKRMGLDDVFGTIQDKTKTSFSQATNFLTQKLTEIREKGDKKDEYFADVQNGLAEASSEMAANINVMYRDLDTNFQSQLESLDTIKEQTENEALRLDEMTVPIDEFNSQIEKQTGTIELDVKSELKGALEQDVKGPSLLSDVIGLKYAFNAIDSWTKDGAIGWLRGAGGTILGKVGTFISEELIGDFPNSWMKAMTFGAVDLKWASISQNWEQTIQILRKTDLGIFTFAPELLAGAMSGIRGLGTMAVDIIKNPTTLVTGLVHIVEHPLEFIDHTLQISSILEGLKLKKNSVNEALGIKGTNLGAALGEGAFNALTFAAIGGAKPMNAFTSARLSLEAIGYSPAVARALATFKATGAILKPTITVPWHALKGVYSLGKLALTAPEVAIKGIGKIFDRDIAMFKPTFTPWVFKGFESYMLKPAADLAAWTAKAPFKASNWVLDRIAPGYKGLKAFVQDAIDAGPKLAARVEMQMAAKTKLAEAIPNLKGITPEQFASDNKIANADNLTVKEQITKKLRDASETLAEPMKSYAKDLAAKLETKGGFEAFKEALDIKDIGAKLDAFKIENTARELRDLEAQIGSKMRKENPNITSEQIRGRATELLKEKHQGKLEIPDNTWTEIAKRADALEAPLIPKIIGGIKSFGNKAWENTGLKWFTESVSNFFASSDLSLSKKLVKQAISRAEWKAWREGRVAKQSDINAEFKKVIEEQTSNPLDRVRTEVTNRFIEIEQFAMKEGNVMSIKELNEKIGIENTKLKTKTEAATPASNSGAQAVETTSAVSKAVEAPKLKGTAENIADAKAKVDNMPESGLFDSILGRRKSRAKQTAQAELKQAELKQKIEELNKQKSDLEKKDPSSVQNQSDIARLEDSVKNLENAILDKKRTLQDHITEINRLTSRYSPVELRPGALNDIKITEGLSEARMEAAQRYFENATYLMNPFAGNAFVLRQVGRLFREGKISKGIRGVSAALENPIGLMSRAIKGEFVKFPGMSSIDTVLNKAFSLSARIAGSPEMSALLEATGLTRANLEALGYKSLKLPNDQIAYLTAEEYEQFDSLADFIKDTGERLAFLEKPGQVLRNESAIEMKTGLMQQTEEIIEKGPESFLDKILAVINAFKEDGLAAFMKLGDIFKSKTVKQFKDEMGEIASTNNEALRNNDKVLLEKKGILLSFVRKRGEGEGFAGSEVYLVRENNFEGLKIKEPANVARENTKIIINGVEHTITDDIDPVSRWPIAKDAQNSQISLINLLRREHAKVMSKEGKEPAIHQEIIGTEKLLGIAIDDKYTEIMESALPGELKKDAFVMEGGKMGIKSAKVDNNQFKELTIDNNNNLVVGSQNMFEYLRQVTTQAAPAAAPAPQPQPAPTPQAPPAGQ